MALYDAFTARRPRVAAHLLGETCLSTRLARWMPIRLSAIGLTIGLATWLSWLGCRLIW
jgi:hypothetical protein